MLLIGSYGPFVGGSTFLDWYWYSWSVLLGCWTFFFFRSTAGCYEETFSPLLKLDVTVL